MRFVLRLLGSVHFSLALFCISALVAGASTLIDLPQRQQNSLFSVLICGFLINLFVSLCSRFPFRRSHLSFVLAHCGLMLILGGALIKGTFGFEGVLVVTKQGAHREIFLDGDRESALLQPFKRACEKMGYSYDEMLRLWFSDWKNRNQAVYAMEKVLPFPLQRVMDSLEWESLPHSFQSGALRLSRFLERRQTAHIRPELAREVFNNAHAPLPVISEWTTSLKAHLYSCCLFAEGLQDHQVQLKLKEIPYSSSLIEADEANYVCRLVVSDASGGSKDVVIGLNKPYDTIDGYRFTLREIAPSNHQAQLLVSWDPTSSVWMVTGTILTVLGIILLFIQKMKEKHGL
ncbi:MAG: hypothetical protein JSR39_05255 [Verrucomicrobia bacterium]|nr:hypothetical protein [Verrucomicrobiota bacterium]